MALSLRKCQRCHALKDSMAFKTSGWESVCGACYAKIKAKPYRDLRASEERTAAREAAKVAEENRLRAESLAPAFARLREDKMAVAPAMVVNR